MALDLPLRPITVDEYHRMVDVGIIDPDERVELLDGMLVLMPPLGRDHGVARGLFTELLIRRLGHQFFLMPASIPLPPQNEPEPDISIFRRSILNKKSKAEWAVSDIVALIEVSDSSLRRDTVVKQRIYARAGVAEYLIADVQKRSIMRYRDPAGDAYRTVEIFGPGQSFELLGAPEVAIDVNALFLSS